MEKNRLAFIIPAYRAQYLHRLLGSLVIQKDRNFKVYVFDDASPEDIASIAGEFEDRLDLSYHRFPDNLGVKGHPTHLARCLAQIGDEPLVWFLADDDELTRDAVGQVRRAARRLEECEVFHLETDWINESSELTGKGRRSGWLFPLTAARLFRRIFEAGMPAPLSSFVFRRQALDRAMFQIRDVNRSPLTLAFAATGTEGRIGRVRRARLWRRPPVDEAPLEKAAQMLSFFAWSEYFFGEQYPLTPRKRVDVFATCAAAMYPALPEEEIRKEFLQMRVFEREMSKGRGKRILHRHLSK